MQYPCLISHLCLNSHDFFGIFCVKDIGPEPISSGDGAIFEAVPILVIEIDQHFFIWVKPVLLGEVSKFTDKLPKCHMLVIFGYTLIYAKGMPN